MRVAVAHCVHETVTFLSNETTVDDFVYKGSPLAGTALLRSGAGSYMGGFVKVAGEYGVELVGLTSPMFPKTGTASAWITEDAYDWIVTGMLGDLAAAGSVDGVFIVLHGAMAVHGVDRPEADLVRRIRHAVGPEPLIAATFDPLGNEDAAFFDSGDLAFCAKYYPHYDDYLQGTRAARAIVRAIRGEYRPRQATCKVPILTPTVMQWTGAPPWSELVVRALVWEARHPDLFVNVFFGFPWSDVIDAGMTVQAIANDDPALAARAVTDLAGFAWRSREGLIQAAAVHTIREGVDRAKSLAGETRVVLADHSDRSGRATWLLRELIETETERALVATVADPTMAARVSDSGLSPGDTFDLDVGGGPERSDGELIRVRGLLVSVVETGEAGNTPCVVVDIGRGSLLVVSPSLTQIVEPSELVRLGVEPQRFGTIALKSRVHFRRGFVDSGFAENVVLVEPDFPFLGTTRLEALPYERLRLSDYYPFGRDEFEPSVVHGRGRRVARAREST